MVIPLAGFGRIQHLVYPRDQLGRQERFLDAIPGAVQKLRALIGGKHAKAGAFKGRKAIQVVGLVNS